jgi:hypothetical protein
MHIHFAPLCGDQKSALPPEAGYLLSVICYQQEAATLIQEETGEWVVGANNHLPSEASQASARDWRFQSEKPVP